MMRITLMLLAALVSATGTSAATADPVADYQRAERQYVDRVGFMMRRNLDLKMVRMADPEAVVSLHFTPEGKFLTLELIERSGDSGFDSAVEFSARRSVPTLPPPPIPPGAAGPFSIAIRVCVTC
jgi:hypothetical protein